MKLAVQHTRQQAVLQVTEVEVCKAVGAWAAGVQADPSRSREPSVAASTDSDEGRPAEVVQLASLPEL